jgi:hypothetical protein
MARDYRRRPARCVDCRYFKAECGYWQLEGTKDKNGNVMAVGVGLVHPETVHACADYQPRPCTHKEGNDDAKA